MKTVINPKILKEIIKLIKEKLPKRAKILVLSLTGSRAFGWANETLDYDIHGLFFCKNYWNYVHSGTNNFDINLQEFTPIFDTSPNNLNFEFFQNIANPIYIHPKFDYREMISFCLPSFCYEPILELKRLEENFSPRATLHCYRVLMAPIYFFETGKFELDIFKINKKYKFKMLPIVKNNYLDEISGKGKSLENKEKKLIRKDLAKLLEKFRKLKEKLQDKKYNPNKLEKWKAKIKKFFK